MTAHEQLGKLGSVRVQMDVEVGRTKLTIGEVLKLRPGSVLTLPVRPAADLSITIGGVLIGECEPIRLEHKAGVRVTRIFRAEEAS